MPFGLKNTKANNKSLKKSFKKHLVIFLGELDNANEKGGRLGTLFFLYNY